VKRVGLDRLTRRSRSLPYSSGWPTLARKLCPRCSGFALPKSTGQEPCCRQRSFESICGARIEPDVSRRNAGRYRI